MASAANSASRLFIDRIYGDSLPCYRPGEDNAAFFRTVFIRLGKYRDVISDDLLEKTVRALAAPRRAMIGCPPNRNMLPQPCRTDTERLIGIAPPQSAMPPRAARKSPPCNVQSARREKLSRRARFYASSSCRRLRICGRKDVLPDQIEHGPRKIRLHHEEDGRCRRRRALPTS